MDKGRVYKQSMAVDKTMKGVFFSCAFFSIVAVFSICLFIFFSSVEAFKTVGVINFVFGKIWHPSEGKYGILPMIVGSLYVTGFSILIGGTIGFFTAVYLSFFCPKKIKTILSQIINLLASIPSIIYGFFAMIVLVPFIKTLSPSGVGEGVLASGLILSIMILPTVASICKSNIEAVSKTYYDGAVALGSSHAQAVFFVVIPAAKSGIFTAIILATGRAIGETMAVIMVAGNAPFIPESLFSYFRTLTINVALEMGYATGVHRSALVATGFVLLIFILLLNLLLNIIKNSNFTLSFLKKKTIDKTQLVKTNAKMHINTLKADILHGFSVFASILSSLSLIFIMLFILIKGLPHITMHLLFGRSGNSGMTLLPAIVSTGMLLFLSLIIAIPIGVFAAIYIVEYSSKKTAPFVKVVRVFTESLAGIPSIIFGLFGMIVFSNLLGFGRSLLAGSFTLVLIILPSIIRQTEETLISIPNSLREGSLALGASKVRTIFLVVLPCGISGIMTSIILSIGRIVGESAALIYTAGAVRYMPFNYLSAGSSFSVMMWMFASEGLYTNQAFATACVLLIIALALNVGLFFIDKVLKKEY
ncbi:MAG: phosphate ABC transporter permease subunit PstC [Treponemataceae bacterium]